MDYDVWKCEISNHSIEFERTNNNIIMAECFIVTFAYIESKLNLFYIFLAMPIAFIKSRTRLLRLKSLNLLDRLSVKAELLMKGSNFEAVLTFIWDSEDERWIEISVRIKKCGKIDLRAKNR